MAHCFVTVEGRTLELEAQSLHYAAIGYNAQQKSGHARHYPPLVRDTILSVLAEGQTEAQEVSWGTVLDWANRVADENARAAKLRNAAKGTRQLQKSPA